MSFINIINESFDKQNKNILAGSNSKKLKEAAFTDNFNGHSDELDRFYDYMFEAAKDLGFQDFDAFDDGWTVTLTYIDTVGNKQQAEFDFDDELSFESKEDAIDCLMSLDWKVIDDEDNDLDEDLDTQSKVSNEIAELKSAFENEDTDLYELQDLVDDLYYDFSDKAFKIVEGKGFIGVYAEPSTQAGIGDDFFTAYKGDVRYEGQYDYEEELNDIANIVINSNAKNREELIAELAEWYADLILDCMEPDEDDLDENTQAKKLECKSKNLTEAQGDFNPATLKKYGVVRDPANDFVDDGNRFTAYLYKGVIPISYLKSKGQVYLSIAFHDLDDVNYDEYKNFGSYQDGDKYNGVPADSVDIEDFVSILERAKKDYEEFKASVKAPNIDDYKAFRKVYADYFKKVLEKAKKLIADNIDTIADLSDYELKKIFEYYKSIKSQLSRWINDDAISQMSPSAIRHDLSSESIERQKKQIANIDDYFYLRYIRDYIEGDKAK